MYTCANSAIFLTRDDGLIELPCCRIIPQWPLLQSPGVPGRLCRAEGLPLLLCCSRTRCQWTRRCEKSEREKAGRPGRRGPLWSVSLAFSSSSGEGRRGESVAAAAAVRCGARHDPPLRW